MNMLAESDRCTADKIRELMFTFEDLVISMPLAFKHSSIGRQETAYNRFERCIRNRALGIFRQYVGTGQEINARRY